MFRSMMFALVVATAAASWSGGHDTSFREAMLPVRLQDDGQRVLLVSRYEVSIASWQQCHAQGACSHMPRGPDNAVQMPVTDINWFDIQEYLAWANAKSGGGLRLPTVKEWQDISRSVIQPPPPPEFTDPRLEWAANYGREKSPSGPVRKSGSHSRSPDGISDLDGNVWEWTSSCFRKGFDGADCPAYIAAGEHLAAMSVFVRDPALGGCAIGVPPAHIGFRLVADK